jgi:uncharacterized protein YecE (DUF72 family)
MDASFYQKFNMYMTRETFTSMVRATPDNFQFSIKVPETVTHDNKLDVGTGPWPYSMNFLRRYPL